MAIQYPLIQGLRYDHSSAEINVNGKVVAGVKEISWSQDLEPGEVEGTYAHSVGDTRGRYKAEAKLVMFQAEAQELVDALGEGYMEKKFDIVVNYGEDGQPLLTRTLLGCRIKKDEEGSSGADPNEVSFDLRVLMVLKNGKKPLSKTIGI